MNILTNISFAIISMVLAQNSLLLNKDDHDKPIDLILAVDVSLSMSRQFKDQNDINREPNDPKSTRWDGIQFAIDTGKDSDRISLIVFRGTPLFLSKFFDPSGFITLGKKYKHPTVDDNTQISGRDLLKLISGEIQHLETQFARDFLIAKDDIDLRKQKNIHERMKLFEEEMPISFLRNQNLKMLLGTSNINCLNEIVNNGLLEKAKSPNRKSYLFLFTDGKDEPPSDNFDEIDKEGVKVSSPVNAAAFDYIKERNQINNQNINAWVEKKIKLAEFRDSGTSILGFALGGTCDNDLLMAIANASRYGNKNEKDDFERLASFYSTKDSVELLNVMENVVLELHNDWKLPIKNSPRFFAVPYANIWQDIGFLIFRQVIDGGTKDAVSPTEGSIHFRPLPPAGDPPRPRPLNYLKALKSRSHWFWNINTENDLPKPLQDSANLEMDFPKLSANETWEGMATVRTKMPLFAFQSPKSGSVFTPKDEIAFRVDFLGDSYPELRKFKAEDFEIKLELSHSKNPSIFGKQILLSLEPAQNNSEGVKVRPFVGSVIIDEDPNSQGKKELLGFYNVDITISAKAGPLAGASRKLMRRVIEIKDYPGLILPAELLISNTSPTPGFVKLPVKLDMKTTPKIDIAKLEIKIVSVEEPFKNSEITVSSNEFLFPKTPDVIFHLKESAWAEKAVGRKNVQVKVKAPWLSEPGTINLVIEKNKYELTSLKTQLINGQNQNKGLFNVKINPQLKTLLDTFEIIGMKEKGSIKLFLESDKTIEQSAKIEKSSAFRAFGLNHPNSNEKEISISLDKNLIPGRWLGEFELAGDNVNPGKIGFEILVDQPKIFVDEGDQKFEKEINQLEILGLSGTPFKRDLKVKTSLGQKVEIAEAYLEQTGKFKEPYFDGFKAEKQNGQDVVSLNGQFPLSIDQGNYTSNLKIKVLTNVAPLLISFPVVYQTSHFGLKTIPEGLVRISPAMDKNPCEGYASTNFKLTTNIENQLPVRWFVECHNDVSGNDKIKWFPSERLELFRANSSQNILNLPGKNEKPTNPLTKNSMENLTINANFKNLEPGIYSQKLVFHSYQDFPGSKEGPLFELPIEIVVPGHELHLSIPQGTSVFADKPIEAVLNVTSYLVPPSNGEFFRVEKDQKYLKRDSDKTTIDGSKPFFKEINPNDSRVFRSDYKVVLNPTRAGKNTFKVLWNKFCKNADGNLDNYEKTFFIDARGELKASERIVYSGETIEVSFSIDPETVTDPKSPIQIQALRGEGKDPIVFDLYDDGRKEESGDSYAGDGIYTGKVKLVDSGHYDLVLSENHPLAKNIQPIPVDVGFDLNVRKNIGSLYYGGGFLGTLCGVKESINEKAATFTNKNTGHLKVTGRLLFPETSDESVRILYIDPSKLKGTKHFDGNIHLDSYVYTNTDKEQSDEKREFEIEMLEQGTVDFFVKANFSEEAQKAIYEGTNHPTLGKLNGLILELNLDWTNEKGETIKRTIKIPVTISANFWIVKGMVSIGILLIITFFGYKLGKTFISKNKHINIKIDDPLADKKNDSNPTSKAERPLNPPKTPEPPRPKTDSNHNLRKPPRRFDDGSL